MMSKVVPFLFRLTLALMLALSAGPSQAIAKSSSSPESNDKSATDTKGVPASAKDVGASYVIATEDTLHVFVWKEPDLTATLPVRSDGKISMPLINDVQAAGMTPMQLAASLTEKLRKFVDDPRVTVVVAQMSRPRIYVMGEVLRHGPISLLPDMTVLQALATSGLTPFANTKKIYVLRTSNGREEKFTVNYKRLVKGQNVSQNIMLQAGDTIVVP